MQTTTLASAQRQPRIGCDRDEGTFCSQLWESIDRCSNILAYVPNHAQISPEFHKDSLSVQKRCPNSDQSSLRDLLKEEGTPLNKAVRQTHHPELNNNDLNSLYVNEPGLYAIILGSNKPKGDALFDWVCRFALPSLRRTGPYTIGQEETHANEKKPMLKIKPQKGAKYFFRDDPQMPALEVRRGRRGVHYGSTVRQREKGVRRRSPHRRRHHSPSELCQSRRRAGPTSPGLATRG